MTALWGKLTAWWRGRRKWTADPSKGPEAVREIRAQNIEAEANRQRGFPGRL